MSPSSPCTKLKESTHLVGSREGSPRIAPSHPPWSVNPSRICWCEKIDGTEASGGEAPPSEGERGCGGEEDAKSGDGSWSWGSTPGFLLPCHQKWRRWTETAAKTRTSFVNCETWLLIIPLDTATGKVYNEYSRIYSNIF